MLRHIYFLTLLLYINISFSFEYFLHEESNYRPVRKISKGNIRSKKIAEKNNGKRQDYEMVYDNDPVAQIDVASFIQSPDDTFDNNQLYEEHDQWKQVYAHDYGSLKDNNEEIASDGSMDQQNYIPIQVPEEYNIYSKAQHIVPQNIYLNELSLGDHNRILDPHKISDNKKINDEFDFGHNPEKKCALKNMKIPFFSRNKDGKTKEKKNKKRKLFGFGTLKKQTQSVSKSGTYLYTNYIKGGYTEPSLVYNNVKKRSYFERLCPSSRKKIVKNYRTSSQKRSRTPNDIIHNSRQYYQANYNKEKDNKIETPNIIIKYKDFEHNLDLHSLKERRKKEVHQPNVENRQHKLLKEYSKNIQSN